MSKVSKSNAMKQSTKPEPPKKQGLARTSQKRIAAAISKHNWLEENDQRKRSKQLESFGHAKSGAGCDHSPEEEVLLGHIQHLTAKKGKNEPIKVSQKERGESGLASTIRHMWLDFIFRK